ncbi:unnamed protein product [Merluccius merluccius]
MIPVVHGYRGLRGSRPAVIPVVHGYRGLRGSRPAMPWLPDVKVKKNLPAQSNSGKVEGNEAETSSVSVWAALDLLSCSVSSTQQQQQQQQQQQPLSEPGSKRRRLLCPACLRCL